MKVLFVCTGNTCRSPMAEYILKSRDSSITVESAGIFAQEGVPMAGVAQNIVFDELSIITQHIARQLTDEIIKDSDYILTMTQDQKNFLIKSGISNVFTIKEFAGETGDVQDPIGSGYGTYLKVFNDLRRLIEIAEEKIKKNNS